MQKIADYDEAGYDYTKYWKGRDYSNQSERIIFSDFYKNLDKKSKSGWFVDIGGSFGRLDSVHRKYFKSRIILDYSFNLLKVAQKNIDDDNLKFVAGNAYKTPFRDGSIRFATSVRLMHHIEDINGFFSEVFRILEPGGIFFFEAANKLHFKARVKNFLKGNRKFFSREPFKQPISKEGLFLNFHPDHILSTLKNVGFQDEKRSYSGSNFRSKLSQILFMQKIFLSADKIFKKIFAKVNFGPSIFFYARKPGKLSETISLNFKKILKFPKSVGLENLNDHNKNGVWDFRVK